jgi:hypothetical protein
LYEAPSEDEDVYKEIITNYILEPKITKSNSMEYYQQDLVRHLKAYGNIKGTEWKKIITNIIKQYHKINEPAFQNGLNTRIMDGPKGHHYYKWLLDMIRWKLETRQYIISRTLWPKIEVAEDLEMTTMPMNQVVSNGWNHNKNSAPKWGSAGTSP